MDTAPSPLAHFRAELYHEGFGLRRDALFDLWDAMLTGEAATSLVRLSLVPGYQRGWASTCDALSDGTLDVAAIRRLCVRTLPAPAPGTRPLWAIDGSLWPRPEAKTSPERTFGRFVTGGQPASGIIGAWEFEWLMALPDATGSWGLPLAVTRRGPTADSVTAVAIQQVRDVTAGRPAAAPRPVVVLDSHYDVPTLIQAELAADWLGRLACNRRFYRAPPPYAGTGRPRKHGPVFRLKEPTTQDDPARQQTDDDPAYGTVTITAWDRLHTQAVPTVALTVLRVTVAHLPRRPEPPAPLWLVWSGATLPDDLRVVWHWYQRRFAIEHVFRFLKQGLGWTTPRVRAPATAERWTWLVATVLWGLWLGRAEVTAPHLPWEHPASTTPSSPGRVRRALAGLLRTLGSPAHPPQPRGKSPGRQRGQCPGRAPRHPIQRRAPPDAA